MSRVPSTFPLGSLNWKPSGLVTILSSSEAVRLVHRYNVMDWPSPLVWENGVPRDEGSTEPIIFLLSRKTPVTERRTSLLIARSRPRLVSSTRGCLRSGSIRYRTCDLCGVATSGLTPQMDVVWGQALAS